MEGGPYYVTPGHLASQPNPLGYTEIPSFIGSDKISVRDTPVRTHIPRSCPVQGGWCFGVGVQISIGLCMAFYFLFLVTPLAISLKTLMISTLVEAMSILSYPLSLDLGSLAMKDLARSTLPSVFHSEGNMVFRTLSGCFYSVACCTALCRLRHLGL